MNTASGDCAAVARGCQLSLRMAAPTQDQVGLAPLPPTPKIDIPESRSFRFKNKVLGRPLHTDQLQHERLGKPTALAVFASDAISSTAYATEEILLVLLMAVTFPQTHTYLVPIGVAAVALLAIVLVSYRQTIHAYPSGGGAYVVSKENVSPMAGLVAGASLLVDYTLTVAVSISSGVLAIGSAFNFNDNATARIGLALFFVAMMCVGNLRGLKESGKAFAVPTYFYVVMLGIFLVTGFYKLFTGNLNELASSAELGLVTKTADPTDGRQVVVTLTPAGEAEVRETRRRRDAWLTQRLAGLSADDRAVLTRAALLLKEMAES